jgi:protein gp37
MSDLFHEEVPESYIETVFDVMAAEPRHRFQILTKRSGRLATLAPRLPWPPDIWMGVSVENEDYTLRIHDLTTVPAHVRFLSVEPLLGPIEALPLDGIHWVVVGGESGPRCRPMDPARVHSIRRQCAARGVPFFFKQWGGTQKKRAGRLLDGREWNEMPIRADEVGGSGPSPSFATR